MTREIKFRVRNPEKKEMKQVEILLCWSELAAYTYDRSWIHNCMDWDEGFFEDPILMQYTGLKDKNGKEIYEGDIVKYRHNAENVIGGQSDVGEVRWYNNSLSYGFHNGVNSYDYWTYSDDMFDFEVIGNIYENPDLLPNQ